MGIGEWIRQALILYQDSPMISVQAIPVFRDNYVWVLKAQDHDSVFVVDPGDGKAVQAYLSTQGWRLGGILVTHHHPDHTAGVPLLAAADNIPVYGPAREKVACCTHPLQDQQQLHLDDLALDLQVLEIPGHTLGHIAYYSAQARLLFCGDTLFSAGCGRLFEGTAQQMQSSLARLRQLPDVTAIYCGHEYTLANIDFALQVEPDNTSLRDYAQQAQDLRAAHKPTLPSTLALEKQVNPFLRWDQPAVVAAASRYVKQKLKDPVAVFAAIRYWKDHFKA
jgi:hydroxyacylglutathione hydrolase